VGQATNAANHLIGVSWVNIGPDVEFYCLIEFGCGYFLEKFHGLLRLIVLF
jgi:hypothetical protein